MDVGCVDFVHTLLTDMRKCVGCDGVDPLGAVLLVFPSRLMLFIGQLCCVCERRNDCIRFAPGFERVLSVTSEPAICQSLVPGFGEGYEPQPAKPYVPTSA